MKIYGHINGNPCQMHDCAGANASLTVQWAPWLPRFRVCWPCLKPYLKLGV